MLGKESPLYGRQTGQFKIEPLDYKETVVFHPNLSVEDNSLIYGITGGVPHQLSEKVTTIITIIFRKADSQIDFFRHKSEAKFG